MEGFQKTHTFGRKFANISRSSQNIPGQMELWNFPMILLSDVSWYLWRWCIIKLLYFTGWKKKWFDNQWHAVILTQKLLVLSDIHYLNAGSNALCSIYDIYIPLVMQSWDFTLSITLKGKQAEKAIPAVIMQVGWIKFNWIRSALQSLGGESERRHSWHLWKTAKQVWFD